MIELDVHNKLRQKFNPEGSLLRNHQKELLKLLSYFDDLCKKNNIDYWLSSGTCLGAIRHGGFIPWDDDIDVEMLRSDYLKLKKVFKENEICELQTYDNDLFYTEPFPKLRLKGNFVSEGNFDKYYKYHGAFMDIFIMEESPYLLAKFCHLLMGSTRRVVFLLNKHVVLASIILKICKPINKMIVNICRIIGRLFNKKGVLRHTYGTGCVKNIRVYDEIFPLREEIFENSKYNIPHNYDNYLKALYGTYMEIPVDIHTHNIINNMN